MPKLQYTAEEIEHKLALIEKNKNLLPRPYKTEFPGGLLPQGFEDIGDGSILTYAIDGAKEPSFSLNTCTLTVGKKYIISVGITNIAEETIIVPDLALHVDTGNVSATAYATETGYAELNLNEVTGESKTVSAEVRLTVPISIPDNLLIKPQIEEVQVIEGEEVLEPTDWVPYMDKIGTYVDERFNGTVAKIKVLVERIAVLEKLLLDGGDGTDGLQILMVQKPQKTDAE